MINKFLLDHKDFTDIPHEDIELIRRRDAKRLQVMEGYCRTSGCLRNYILEYFGEKRNEPCDSCGNCHREFTEMDMTEDAKRVINCVWERKGRYGFNILLGTLLGANRARLKEIGTTEYKTYGALKNRSESELRLLVGQLLLDGYLYQTADKYSVIRLGNIEPLKEAGYELFEVLRQLRLAIAREEGMPPYIVFSDKTLIDMSVKAPRDRSSMLDVSGVGEAKCEKYGERFIEAITAFMDENPVTATSIKDDEDASDAGVRSARRRKKHKGPFYLNPDDGEKFEYHDLYLLAEIKDELNRITTGENVKHIFGTDIYKLLTEKGYVEERNIGGRFVQAPTETGEAKGIAVVEQTSKMGTVYTVLKYPPAVQKEIVKHYIEIHRPDGAGAS